MPARRPAAHAFALVGIAALLSACGSSPTGAAPTDSAGSTEPGVALFLSTTANSYEQAQADGVKAAAEKLGAGEVQVFDGAFDSTKQIGQIQDATTSGKFKVFVIEPVDGNAVVAPLTRASGQGVKIVCITSACGPDSSKIDVQFDGQTGVVASDYGATAKALAERAIATCAGVDPCKVFYINGDTTFPSDRAAVDAVKAAMKEAPSNVEYVGTQDGKYDTATGRTVMQSALQREPDLDVVISLADQQTLGAQQAIDAAGKKGQVKLISFGGSEQAAAAVVDGTWLSSLVTVPFTIGERGAEIGIKSAKNEQVDKVAIDASTLSPFPDGFLTKENIGTFKAQWVA